MKENKTMMLGNAAIARGLYEAGCRFVSSYPGTPSTEITKHAAEYEEVYAEWAVNEKVGLEAALGASIAGARAFCGMKHVGLNVAADALFSASYTGVNGGLVVAVADDAGMHSSQDEQDSRHFAIFAKVPMLEPSSSGECLEFTKFAFDFSEEFNAPVLVRLGTRICHSNGIVTTGERKDVPLKDYKKDIAKYVMMPAFARGAHVVVEKRFDDLQAYAEKCPLNVITRDKKHPQKGGLGIISAGISYAYAKEAFGEDASYLKLGLVNPLPDTMLKNFVESCDRVIVIEELDGIIEKHCKALGLKVEGKNMLPIIGEYSQEIIRECVFGEKSSFKKLDEAMLPTRPPVLCPGCSHRGVFHVLNRLGLMVSGDIGCYTLGALAPLSAMDTCLCMGAAVSALHGFDMVRKGKDKIRSIAVIGDSTFMHSGITGLIDITYNNGNSKILVLDNITTGMTGGQHNPATGVTLKNEPSYLVKVEDIAKACGVKNIAIVDAYDIEECERVISEEMDKDGVSVIIARRPCALNTPKAPAKTVDQAGCNGCKLCLKIACPALKVEGGKASINEFACFGCGVCAKLCKRGAIK